MIEYDALVAAREMAAKDTREAFRRIHEHTLRQKSDPTIKVPLGFKYIDTAPMDGTFVRLRCRPHRVLPEMEFPEEVGRFKIEDGFFGWFNRADELLRWPLFWAPEHGTPNN